MSITYGFFNSLLNPNGTYDRTYNAEDYSDNLAAIISNGVLRDASNGFHVTADGLTLTVSPGRAWINGHWVKLDSAETLIQLPAPTGDNKRIDNIVLRLLTAENERRIQLEQQTGVPSVVPVATSPVRTYDQYELIIARVEYEPNATSVTVTDTRADKTLCGWVTTPVGYDDYFKSMDAAFEEWFAARRNDLAVSTLFKQYTWRTVLEETTGVVTFDISQYHPLAGTDIVEVYVNGLRQTLGVDYRRDFSTITFLKNGGALGEKIAGTEIVVVVYKSIDGTGLGSVVDEVTELQNNVLELNKAHEYTYICNGKDDNVKLSELCVQWQASDQDNDYGSKIIRVFGTFGATAAYSGAGTVASPYIWLQCGAGVKKKRKFIFDFSGCSQISLNVPDGSHNVIFYGRSANIKGANVVATGGLSIKMFSDAAATVVNAEECRLWVTSFEGLIARGGTFRDCRTSLTVSNGNAQAFNVLSGGLLRIFGGEHYAYAPTGNDASVVYVNSAQTDAVVLTYGINCPQTARSGYVQTYAVNCLTNNAQCSFTDTITPLQIVAEGQNIRGTIAVNKAGLL